MKNHFRWLLYLIMLVVTETNNNEQEFNLNFQQNDYELKPGRAELVRFNKDYLKDMKVITYKYNRTAPVVNATFTLKVELGNEVTIIVQAYKFMSNEYRFFPIHFGANLCKILAANVAGMRFMKCGNFTGCPLLNGKTYHVCNFYPDTVKFPPFIPSGEYMIEVQALYRSAEVFVIKMYATITRPITIQ